MIDETTKEEAKDAGKKPDAPVKAAAKTIMVRSSRTLDFPGFGWGIHEGETLALPVDEAEQKIILSNQYISVVK